ncbi:hypothetical protein [Bifidobacterium adolescentis]|uniref:hypothetical protein n=1 Tax=Bifidobacterium adolescentis TaxID=1680 RepID=UPI002A68765F|nr:hypothetical protein [Bifidobacterium adolescentis]
MGKSSTAFGRYSMSGGRFEEAEGLPISVLEELKNYKDLVVDVADHLYKREHPQCKKLPNGFLKEIDLRITGIKHGCVVVELSRIQEEKEQLLLWDEDHDCVEDARKLINETISNIKRDGDLYAAEDFPSESLPRLYRLGSYLNKNEKLTLANTDKSNSVDIDNEWRDIVARLNEKSPLVERVIDGKLIGMSSNKGETFTYDFLIYNSQKKISAKAGAEYWDKFYDFLDNRDRARMCSLSVVCKMNDDNSIESIEQTHGIKEALPEEILNQMEELAHLEEGWYGICDGHPQGLPIEEKVFRSAQLFLDGILSYAHSEPKIIDLAIFPQIDGGLQIEWKDLEFEVDFETDGTTSAFNFNKPDEDCEKVFPVDCRPKEILNWLIGSESDV